MQHVLCTGAVLMFAFIYVAVLIFTEFMQNEQYQIRVLIQYK